MYRSVTPLRHELRLNARLPAPSIRVASKRRNPGAAPLRIPGADLEHQIPDHPVLLGYSVERKNSRGEIVKRRGLHLDLLIGHEDAGDVREVAGVIAAPFPEVVHDPLWWQL